MPEVTNVKPLKILHVTHDWGDGGAAIGARRLYSAMKKYGINCDMLVTKNNHPLNNEPIVHAPRKLRMKLAVYVYRFLARRQITKNPVLKSFNLIPTGLVEVINNSDADIVQCHWLGANTLSIPELAKIKKPVFWKLPDMWAISGAEHYDLHEDIPRYKLGYSKKTLQTHEGGFDLNKWIWLYKKWHWTKKKLNIHIACPSSWLAQCVKDSIIFKGRTVRHILNPINTDLFRPKDRLQSLKSLGLEHLAGKKIIGFGADAAMTAKRKGYHHLLDAIEHLSKTSNAQQYALLIFGAAKPEVLSISGIEAHSLGRIDDVHKIIDLYNSTDTFVLPTLRDNLPNVIKEAMVCGIPCVGFNVGGMPDMINHRDNGYLAKPFCAKDLAKGIEWVLETLDETDKIKIRDLAKKRHGELEAVQNYLDYYKVALGEDHKGLNEAIKLCAK